MDLSLMQMNTAKGSAIFFACSVEMLLNRRA